MASAGDARYPASIPGLGISPGEGNGNPLQYSYLENCLDRGAWRATAVGLQRVERGLVNEHTLDRSVCPVLEAGALRLRRSRPFSLGGPRGACTMHPPFYWVPHPWLRALTPALASRGLTLSHGVVCHLEADSPQIVILTCPLPPTHIRLYIFMTTPSACLIMLCAKRTI